MKEVGKESLSALIDGEANEIEIHRFVREFGRDESITQSWSIYQQIRMTARAVVASPPAAISLRVS